MKGTSRIAALVVSAAVLTVSFETVAGAATTAAPPVGPLPAGPTTTVSTQPGQLVAFALPHRANGRVWRVAGKIDPTVLVEVSEADVGPNVVLVFKTTGKGTAKVSFGLTRGERAKAYEARRFVVNVKT
jgi:hypothetical protein